MMATIIKRINNINDDKTIDLALRLVAIILLTAIIAAYLIVSSVNIHVADVQKNIVNTINIMEVF